MRYIALAVICLGFTAAAVYQQMHHHNSEALSLGVVIAFVLVIVPDDLMSALVDRIKKEI